MEPLLGHSTPGSRLASVGIRDEDGRLFAHVTAGASLFEVAATAIRKFESEYWHGPRPAEDTVLEVKQADNEYRVLVCTVRKWMAERTAA